MRSARILTALIVPLGIAASAGGLFLPGLYRDNAWVAPQNRGQDLVTLLLMPVLAAVSRAASPRATLVGIGLLGYVFYTYTGASFAYAFNRFFLIYVALFSLSVFALLRAGAAIDAAELARRFDNTTPRRAVAGFLLFIAFMLTVLWLGQILPFLTSGTLPESIRRAGGPTMFVYVLDLGIVVPVAVLAAVWLLRGRPWGYVLAGCVLIKAATMGLALLSMTWFAMRAGLRVEPELAAAWVLIAAGGLAMSFWFFRHCRG